MARILITGGAGFIGSHLADRLLAEGNEIRALDRLDPRVHPAGGRPEHLDPAVELIEGDVRDPTVVAEAVRGVDRVVHLAAAVGIGRSMEQLVDCTGTNHLGTAVLLEALMRRPVEKLVVASSMSIYGEGLARRPDGQLVEPEERNAADLAAGRWEPVDADGSPLEPVPTPESKRPALASIYALSKLVQERMALLFGRAHRVPVTALRLFDVFGCRQPLSNPYTGVLASFAARLLDDRPPVILEDGMQRRDFVHARDVARAFAKALEPGAADGMALNVGSGVSRTVADVARALAAVSGRPDLQPIVSGEFRSGGVRHCFADTNAARRHLGFVATEDFHRALTDFAGWMAGQGALDRVGTPARDRQRPALAG